MAQLSPEHLPDDVSALKAMIGERDHELYAMSLLIEKLKHQLAFLRRGKFGASSEGLDQLDLLVEELEAEQAEAKAASPVPDDGPDNGEAKQQPKRKAFPADIPRRDEVHEPSANCAHCGTPMRALGDDIREVLDYEPGRFVVTRHIRPKMSCRDCGSINQAPMPSLPIERGNPGASLLAHVLVSKYADHLPLYRQNQIHAREGVEIDRSTLADWVGRSAYLLQPLADRLAHHVFSSKTIHTDDIPLPVLDPGAGEQKPAGYGVMFVMKDLLGLLSRQRSFISIPRIEKAFTQRAILISIRALFTPMVMVDIKTSSNVTKSLKLPALPISGVNCLIITKSPAPLLLRRHWGVSLSFTPSKKKSGDHLQR